MRRLSLAIAAVLVLAGCGANSLDDVKVSGGDRPKLSGVEEFSVEETTTRVLKEGKGDELKEGDVVVADYVAVNGRTGKEFDSTFAAGKPANIELSEGLLPGFLEALPGQKVGSRLLVAVPPKDGFDQGIDQYDIAKTDTILFLFDLRSVADPLLEKASGTAKKLPADVPQIVLDKDKNPSKLKATATTPKSAKKGAHVAILGKGAVVTKGQNVSVHYVGQKYPNGDVFDTSWDGDQPFSFQAGVGGAITCFNQVVGHKVGSRLVLVCPRDSAYGKNPQQGQPAGDLVFVVDLLGAV